MRGQVAALRGQAISAREIGPVTQTDIVRFAGAGGDFNPLHHDPAYARAAGFPRVIAMGQWVAGLLAAWLTDWCGVENLREYEVRFAAPVLVGDVLRLSGEIVAIDHDGIAEVALRVTRGEDTVVHGAAKIAVPRAP